MKVDITNHEFRLDKNKKTIFEMETHIEKYND